MNEGAPDQILANLRVEIDRIDASMHRLLMERGEIINRLISVKARLGGGSAFRPGREASMMRGLLGRHEGLLPLDTIEGIWRIIISTFTYVQANFSVHADTSSGDAVMRDSVRFHFGFTVPFIDHRGVAAVIEAVGRSDGDLGLLRLDGGTATGAWWCALTAREAPKIIAKLPMVDRPNHPASLPVFLVSKPLNDAAVREVVIYAISVNRWRDGIRRGIESICGSVLATAADRLGLSLLVSAPGEVSQDTLKAKIIEAGVSDVRLSEIGSHAIISSLMTKRGGAADSE